LLSNNGADEEPVNDEHTTDEPPAEVDLNGQQ
jgi:hypothetical protein